MKKKILLFVVMFCSIATMAFAFLFQVTPKTAEEIKSMSTEVLQDAYLEASIEKRAVEQFYTRSSFQPKEFQKYKDLLKYVVLLRKEMQNRDIEPTPYEQWLR